MHLRLGCRIDRSQEALDHLALLVGPRSDDFRCPYCRLAPVHAIRSKLPRWLHWLSRDGELTHPTGSPGFWRQTSTRHVRPWSGGPWPMDAGYLLHLLRNYRCSVVADARGQPGVNVIGHPLHALHDDSLPFPLWNFEEL